MADHLHKFLVLFRDANGMQYLLQFSGIPNIVESW